MPDNLDNLDGLTPTELLMKAQGLILQVHDCLEAAIAGCPPFEDSLEAIDTALLGISERLLDQEGQIDRWLDTF